VRARRAAGALLATGVAAAAVIPAADGATTPPPRKTVKVGDDYFAPAKLTVRRGTVVVFKWLNSNTSSHDVKLRRAPRGVKRWHSDPAATYYSYRRKLRVRGKYNVVCTFHVGMVMNIVVK
jgi:plastocyanin